MTETLAELDAVVVACGGSIQQRCDGQSGITRYILPGCIWRPYRTHHYGETPARDFFHPKTMHHSYRILKRALVTDEWYYCVRNHPSYVTMTMAKGPYRSNDVTGQSYNADLDLAEMECLWECAKQVAGVAS